MPLSPLLAFEDHIRPAKLLLKLNRLLDADASPRSDGELVDQLRRVVEAHAEEDKQRRELAEVKNKAESMSHDIEKQLKEMGDKLPADQIAPLQAKVDSLKKAVEANDHEAMKSGVEELEKMFAAAYQAAAAAGATAQTGSPDATSTESTADSGPKGNVVDAEVVDEKKA